MRKNTVTAHHDLDQICLPAPILRRQSVAEQACLDIFWERSHLANPQDDFVFV